VVLWGGEEGETSEAPLVQQPAALEEPAAPAFTPEELSTALEAVLNNMLPDLVRKSISPAVAKAVVRWLGDDEPAVEEAEASGTSDANTGNANPENANPENANKEQLDPMLFLAALAQSDALPHGYAEIPNGSKSPSSEANHDLNSRDLNNHDLGNHDWNTHGWDDTPATTTPDAASGELPSDDPRA
jgi:hypothetical protein